MSLPLLERVGYAFHVLLGTRPPPVVDEVAVPDMVLSVANPLDTERGLANRQEAALSMMDEDCDGFLLITLNRESDAVCEVRVASMVKREWWPAVAITLDKVVDVALSHDCT